MDALEALEAPQELEVLDALEILEALEVLEVLEALEALEMLEVWSEGGCCRGQHNALTTLHCSCLGFPSAAAPAWEGLLSFSPLVCGDLPLALANVWRGLCSARQREEFAVGNAVVLTFGFIQN